MYAGDYLAGFANPQALLQYPRTRAYEAIRNTTEGVPYEHVEEDEMRYCNLPGCGLWESPKPLRRGVCAFPRGAWEREKPLYTNRLMIVNL